MGGKSSTTTQGVSIPPEVLARYNAVNARAEDAASTPFKEYSKDPNAFVAPLTQTQLSGIQGTNAAANQAQPYYQAATGQLIGAQQVGQYNTGQAYNDLNYAQQAGQYGTQQAYEPLNTGYYQGQAGVGASYGTINNSMYDAQNINRGALGGLGNAAMLGYAGNNTAGNSIYNAQQAGNAMTDASGNSILNAQRAGNAMTDASGNSILNAQAAGNNMTNTAANTIYGAQNMALGTGADAFNTQYQGMLEGKGNTASANNTLFNAYEGVQPLQQQAINNMVQSYYGAQGYNQRADQQYQQSLNQADPLNQAAIQQYAQGLGAAAPINYQALSQIGQSLEGAQPFQRQAQDLALAGMQGVSPGQIGGQQIGQFMSPYISSVLEGTRGMLDQQNQQAMAGQTANAIRQGAFGGDRAGIAAASLAQQQQLANAQIYSGILNQGYGQALGAAQQQQGVNLAAEQANRAAIQQGSQAMLGIGQQGFGQGMTAAQQQAAMAQQLYSQQAGAGQNLAQIGQQIYGQQAGAGQNLAGLGQQQYGQGMGLSQAQLGAGQQQFAQGAQTAQQQAANAKQMYDMTAATATHQQDLAKLQFNIGSTTAAQQAALGQQTFGMGATTAQQQAANAQQTFGMGATTAQQQAANAQQTFGMGATTAQQQAALAQQGYAMGSGTAMNQANIGNMQFGQGATTAQQQAALAQQQFGMGSTVSQQRAALAQQQYAQGANTAQQRAALAQQQYGMGANTSQQMAALGAGAQGAALQGAQAQLAAGQMQQQTQQAGLQALYNQFLQQQSYPFQTAQFLANVAMGTGALSGNTTTTTQPGGFFSDERLKENVKEVGKTFDGQPIYSYNYKGGDKRQQIGLMAQEVEDKHPDAVGLAGGYKTVDYGKATENAAERGHFYSGGAASMGGGVNPGNYGEGFANGGMPMGGYDPALMQQILQNYNAMYGTLAQPGQPGMLGSSMPGAGGIVPSANLPVSEMLTPAGMPEAPDTGLDRASQIADLATKGHQTYKDSAGARARVKRAYDTYKTNQSHKEAASGISDYMDKNGDPMGNLRYRAAGGGVGLDPELAQQMMQRSQGMYGAPSGPAAVGAPAGGLGAAGGIVPATSAPAPTILKAGSPPPKPESGLDKVAKIASIASSAATAGKGAQDLMAARKGDQLMKDAAQTVKPFDYEFKPSANLGFATGGAPYDASATGPNALNIPDEKKEFEVLKPGEMPEKPESGLSKAAKVAQIAAAVMALKTGGAVSGRKSYATNGGVLDPNGSLLQRLGHQLFIGGTPEEKAAAAQKARDSMRQTGRSVASDISSAVGAYPAQAPKAADIDFMDPNIITRLLYNGMDPRTRRPDDSSAQQQASGVRSVYAPTVNENATPPAPRQRPVAAAPRQGGLAAGAPPAPPAAAPAAPAPSGTPLGTRMGDGFTNSKVVQTNVPRAHNFGTGERDIVPQGLGGVLPTAAYVPGADEAVFAGKHPFLSGAKDYLSKSENVVPLLAGLAAMGTAPTRSLGVALASGVGAGAKSYMDVRKQQADIGETKARTSVQQAQATREGVGIQKEMAELLRAGYVPQEDPNGKYLGPDGKRYRFDPPGTMVRPGTPNGQRDALASSFLGKIGEDKAYEAVGRHLSASPETKVRSNEDYDDTLAASQAAKTSWLGVSKWADAVSFNDKGFLQPGALAPLKVTAASYWNSILDTLIQDPAEAAKFKFNTEALSEAEIATKMATNRALVASQGAGQRSLGALEQVLSATPNQTMSRQASMSLIADMYVENMRQIDKAQYLQDFDAAAQAQGALPRGIITQEALQAFDAVHRPENYERDRKAITETLLHPDFAGLKKLLTGGSNTDRAFVIKTLDDKYGKGFHRYFTGG